MVRFRLLAGGAGARPHSHGDVHQRPADGLQRRLGALPVSAPKPYSSLEGLSTPIGIPYSPFRDTGICEIKSMAVVLYK